MAVTSHWGKVFRDSLGALSTGKDIDLYTAGGSKVYDLTESPSGYYYNDAVDTGIYDIYIDGVKEYSDVFIGSGRIKIISDNFNDTGELSSSGIQDSAVTTAKINDYAVSTNKLANYAVTTAKLITSAVTEDKIQASAVTAGKIAAGAVTTVKIDAEAITTDKVADDAITTAKIDMGAVGAYELDTDAVTTDKIVDHAVTQIKIGNDAVSTDQIAAKAMTQKHFEDGLISASILSDGSIETLQIADDAVTQAKLDIKGTAAPTTGTYEAGDVVLNSGGSLGERAGWICTSSGSPGTWHGFGQIAMREEKASDLGTVTPHFMGEILKDDSSNDMYIAYGTSSGNWLKITP